eukprot:355640-Chlamydomonas_euryale.AAC.3
MFSKRRFQKKLPSQPILHPNQYRVERLIAERFQHPHRGTRVFKSVPSLAAGRREISTPTSRHFGAVRQGQRGCSGRQADVRSEEREHDGRGNHEVCPSWKLSGKELSFADGFKHQRSSFMAAPMSRDANV